MPGPSESWGMSTLIKPAPAAQHLLWAAHYAAAWNDCALLPAAQAWGLIRTPPLGSSSFLIHGETVLYGASLAPSKGDFVVVVTDDCYPSYKVHKVTK